MSNQSSPELPMLDLVFASLPSLKDFHAPTTPVYGLLKEVVHKEIKDLFSGTDQSKHAFGPFGDFIFPYTEMGTINSLDLFGLDELLIFSFYWHNRNRYHRTLDLGANIGIHSLIMSRCGFDVTCFEPDPRHFELLQTNLANNNATSVTPMNAAISIERGEMEFVRVLGNTTGSHLAGAKSNVYGDTDRFTVEVEPFVEHLEEVDLIKMDVEGHEAVILCTTTADQWASLDMICEVGTQENAKLIFDHLRAIGVNLFAQKINWQKIETIEDMPTSYKEGSLFISAKDAMPWT